MAVILPSAYRDGTTTVVQGGTTVTGQGTLFLKSVLPGDWYTTDDGYFVMIASVDSNTSLTLISGYPGASRVAGTYSVMLQSDIARMQETSRQLLEALQSGPVYGLSALPATPNSIYGTDASGQPAILSREVIVPARLASTAQPVVASGALNSVSETGWVRVASADVTTVGGPAGGGNGVCFTIVFDANSSVQTYTQVTSASGASRQWVRNKAGGVWTDWTPTVVGDVSNASNLLSGTVPNDRFPSRLKPLPDFVSDWNNVRENGFYFGGPQSVNTPAQPWSFVGFVKAQSSSYCVQTLTALGVSDPASNVTFERQIVNNVPSAWFRVRYTEAELDARYMRPSQAVANSQLPGRLRQDGQVITDWNNAIQSGFYFGESAANSPPGIDGGLIGYVASANGDGAVVQTVVRWWGITATSSATWRRAKQGPNSWTTWEFQLTNISDLDARYNRLGVEIPNSQLPFIQTGKNFTSYTMITGGPHVNGGSAFGIGPSDSGIGKPGLFFGQTPNAPQWNIDIYDGATTSGTLNFGAGSLTHNGAALLNVNTGYTRAQTYTQAETRSLVTTARQVRLGAMAEFGTTAFVWNEAAAGSFITGVFLDGTWGVRNVRHRAVQQTDINGNWVTVAQA